MNWELAAEQRDRFFELTLDMLCISSGDGYFKWLNPAFTLTLGWSMDELLTHPYTFFVHPDDLDATLREVELQMTAGERVLHFENRYRHKDGSWRVLSWKSTPFAGLMYAVARDVTERDRLKRALETTNTELELRVAERTAEVLRSERQLRLFIEGAPAAIAMFDLEMRYIAASRRFIEDYRVKESELIGRSHYDVFPDVPERWRNIHRRCLAGAVERCEEDPFPRSDGKIDWVKWEMRPWYENESRIGGVILFSEVITERKWAAQALEEIQELQRRVERAAKIGHWYWRATGGAANWREGIAEYSDSGLAILGLEPGHPPFTNLEYIQRFVHPDDREIVEQAFGRGDTTAGYALEYRIIRPDGQVRVIDERAEHHVPENGAVLLSSGVLQDVTEERAAAEAVRTSEERYRQVVELSQELIWIHTDGVIVFANTFAAKLLGAKGPEDLVGRQIVSLIHPDDRKLSLGRTTSVLNAGSALPVVELRLRALNGRDASVEIVAIPYLHHGKQSVLAIGRDVTGHRRAEEALRETEGIAHQVLQTAISAYVRMSEDGRITEWNSQAEQIFGWSREEAVGRLLAETIIPASQQAAHAHGLRHYVATGESQILDQRIELQAVRRSGEEFPVEAVITAITTKKGRVFSAFLRDVTERKRTEQHLQQAQKLEAVGQLTAGIAHDFNNLLGVVVGNLDAVLEGMDPESEAAAAITRALNGALHGAELTHRLLGFARQQDLEPKALAINELLPDLVSILNRTLGESITVRVVPCEDLWPAFADSSQVRDAVLNLAINARDAMPDGGTLTIETANVTLDEEYARENLDAKRGDYALLAVTDTGVGMTPEVMKHAMEPFFTTKPVGKGTGLGLSMIYGFARQSGGHLSIYSEVGRGTTVKLYLPRAKAAATPEPEPAMKPMSLPRGSETILVVEDNVELRRTAVSQLMKLGYRVLEAENGEVALAMLKGSDVIDLLFSDIVMTGQLTGRRLAQEAREFRPQMRILLTTGYAEKATADESEGWQLLHKPYRQQELALKVRDILDGRGG